jgi:predicted ATPase/DNA-binding winged helix-turn-helix (wHTH) protein
MPSAPQLFFEPFRLDVTNACLWREQQQVALRPKVFAVLAYLVAHAGQLVTKEALLTAVWPETTVSDTVLKACIGLLRKALGETAAAPQFIATVHRRGYRFIAPVTAVASPAETTTTAPAPAFPRVLVPPPLLVEREAVLHQLRTRFAEAGQGRRQVVLVTGEPGIGKTAVVDAFTTEVATRPGMRVAWGQCLDHYGAGEAYLPVLEALGQLCQGLQGAQTIAVLRQQAPTWLVQMPWLLSPADRDVLHHELGGATRERMLRELAVAVDTLTIETPLVLVLEDLHWSDHATLDLFNLLARRREPARLLLLGTYRPVEAIVRDHPLRAVAQDLQLHGHCTAVQLGPLSSGAIRDYLAIRFPGCGFPEGWVPRLYHRTDGHPLFLVNVIEQLIAQGRLVEQAGEWEFFGSEDDVDLKIPESLRQMIAQQLDRLTPAEQQVIETGSVQGVMFSTALMASGLEADVAQLEAQCEGLTRQGHILRSVGVMKWPDGTMITTYAFRHALYQQVAYQRIGVAHRVRLHRQLAVRLEAAYGPLAGELATELAWHFEQGREYPRAVQYLQQAAATAVRRHAHQEAIDHLQRALALLQTFPDTPERTQQQLHVYVALGGPLMATKGQTAPEVEQTYSQAYALCQQVEDTAQLLPVLAGLRLFYVVQAAHQTAQELSQRLLTLAQRHHDQAFLLEAQVGLGGTLFFSGQLEAALTQLLESMVRAELREPPSARVVHHPKISCYVYASWVRWCLGYPDQAEMDGQHVLTQAQYLSNPYIVMWSQSLVANTYLLCGRAAAAQQVAEDSVALARQLEVPFWEARSAFMRGVALTQQGDIAEGLAQMQESFAAIQTSGVRLNRVYFLARLAETLTHASQPDAALAVLTEALALIDTSGEHWWEAECYRLWGECVLAKTGPERERGEAAARFQQALAIARHQRAKSLELRAATSLARLWQQQNKRRDACDLLAPIYEGFTEGFDTADLQDAKVLLEELER